MKISDSRKELHVIMVNLKNVKRTFMVPFCKLNQSSWVEPQAQHWRNILFLHSRPDDAPPTLQILDLTAIYNYKYEGVCIPVPVVDTHIGKYKAFIYTIKEDNILERRLITPDGKTTDPTIVAKTKYVCLSLFTLIIVMFSQLNQFVSMEKTLQ